LKFKKITNDSDQNSKHLEGMPSEFEVCFFPTQVFNDTEVHSNTQTFFIAGGLDPYSPFQNTSAKCFVYTLMNCRINQLEPMDDSRTQFAMVPVIQQKDENASEDGSTQSNCIIMVMGGLHREESETFTLRSCEAYNPESDSWMSIQDMNGPRSNASACQMDGYCVYIFGGFTENQTQMLNTIEKYNINLDVWLQLDIILPSPLCNTVSMCFN
jgi:N-acetylneuraminic acid mutarotase